MFRLTALYSIGGESVEEEYFTNRSNTVGNISNNVEVIAKQAGYKVDSITVHKEDQYMNKDLLRKVDSVLWVRAGA